MGLWWFIGWTFWSHTLSRKFNCPFHGVFSSKTWMYYIIWIHDSKIAPIQSNRVARLAHTAKKFLASGFTSVVCSPLNMCSSVTPMVPLAQPAYENAQSHRGEVEVSCQQTSLLQWWSMRKILFGPRDFSLQYREWPLGKIGSKAEQRRRIQF